MTDSGSTLLVILHPSGHVLAPNMVSKAGAAASFAWDEFFQGQIRNKHTRTAYLRAVRRFVAWVEPRESELSRITPGLVGLYFDDLASLSTPSKKVHLAAIRSFFDVLVQRHVVLLNPASSVRTERYSTIEGRTPEITVEQSRRLLAAIRLEVAVHSMRKHLRPKVGNAFQLDALSRGVL